MEINWYRNGQCVGINFQLTPLRNKENSATFGWQNAGINTQESVSPRIVFTELLCISPQFPDVPDALHCVAFCLVLCFSYPSLLHPSFPSERFPPPPLPRTHLSLHLEITFGMVPVVLKIFSQVRHRLHRNHEFSLGTLTHVVMATAHYPPWIH